MDCTSTDVCRAGEIQFRDTTSATGLTFRHISPLTPARHLHLVMGSGVAWSDWDRDGSTDPIFCQGAPFASLQQPQPPAVSLFRNRPGPKMHPVTSAQSTLTGTGYAMGVTVGDYDNDGFPDLFISGLPRSAVYRNQGDGTWADVTTAAGVTHLGFSTGCTWLDLDRDGMLDLFCARYVAVDAANYPVCATAPANGKPSVAYTCHPKNLVSEPDVLYRSLGDGRFEDISQSSGLLSVPARQGLGAIAADFDADGDADLYVANDTTPNDLWENVGGGKLVHKGLESGAAVNRLGASEASMGVAVADVDGDLRPVILVTNYFNETNTLYRNEGGLQFWDVTEDFGVAALSRNRLGFGVNLADFNNDGWPDVFIANGHVQDQLHLLGRKHEPFAQLSQVLINRDGQRFVEISQSAGSFFKQPYVARGSAVADYDGDGRVDLLVSLLDSLAILLRNESTTALPVISLELIGRTSNRQAVGASVQITSRGGNGPSGRQRYDRMASQSYLSSDDGLISVTFPRDVQSAECVVRWPNGTAEQFSLEPKVLRQRLIEGTGKRVTDDPRTP